MKPYDVCKRRAVVRDAPEPPPVTGARWIALSSGRFTLVDDVDFEDVNRFTWSLHVDGRGKEYAARKPSNGPCVKLHRYIFGAGPREQVDHRDNDGLNNRRQNLRKATNQQNSM